MQTKLFRGWITSRHYISVLPSGLLLFKLKTLGITCFTFSASNTSTWHQCQKIIPKYSCISILYFIILRIINMHVWTKFTFDNIVFWLQRYNKCLKFWKLIRISSETPPLNHDNSDESLIFWIRTVRYRRRLWNCLKLWHRLQEKMQSTYLNNYLNFSY